MKGFMSLNDVIKVVKAKEHIADNYVPAGWEEQFMQDNELFWSSTSDSPLVYMDRQFEKVGEEVKVVEFYSLPDDSIVVHFQVIHHFFPNFSLVEDLDVLNRDEDLCIHVEPHVAEEVRFEE